MTCFTAIAPMADTSAFSRDPVPSARRPPVSSKPARLCALAHDLSQAPQAREPSDAAACGPRIGFDVAGVDFMALDIAHSVRDTGASIVEVNSELG